MYYNTHIHTFRDVDIPDRFLPLKLVRFLATKPGYFLTAKLLNNINPFSDNDLLDRYVKFVSIGRKGSQKAIFENCMKYYPKNTNFGILPMDMAFMGSGKVRRNYPEQLEELYKLKKIYPQIFAAIHIDPRRKGVFDLMQKCVEDWGFTMVKLYPPLGYFPYDERLMPVYDYCSKNNISVMSHCSPYNPVHFKGSKSELKTLLAKAEKPINTKGKKKKELCSYFTHPRNYINILNEFPDLNICLAHFGSSYFWDKYLDEPEASNNWFVIIKELLKEHKNLFSDISFTLNRENFFPLLKVLLVDEKIRSQVLFGSDYYMVETKVNERRFSIDLRSYLGEQLFNTIAVENPRSYLHINV